MKIFKWILVSFFLLECSASVEESYYPSGQLEYRVSVKDGVRNGELKKYYENGKIQYVSNWNNGVKEGEATAYFADGTIRFKENYENGLPNGTIEEYYGNGQLKKTMIYENGQLLSEASYFDDGIIEGEVRLNSDTTTAIYYHHNGLIDEISVRVGEELLYAKRFQENGNLISSTLPVKSVAKVSQKEIMIDIDIAYTSCELCDYLVILGEFDESHELKYEYYRDTFPKGEISITFDLNSGKKLPFAGSIYELDTLGHVVGYSPFDVKKN